MDLGAVVVGGGFRGRLRLVQQRRQRERRGQAQGRQRRLGLLRQRRGQGRGEAAQGAGDEGRALGQAGEDGRGRRARQDEPRQGGSSSDKRSCRKYLSKFFSLSRGGAQDMVD